MDPKAGQKSICILPDHQKLGGPASFQARLTRGLTQRGWAVTHDPKQGSCRAVLVIAGTKRIDLLLWSRQQRLRVVQRLNGMNWTHKKTRTGLKHYLRSEIINALMSSTRRHLADAVVYQSEFTRNWWNTVFGQISAPAQVVHNGTDLESYRPVKGEAPPAEHVRVLVIEGHLGGGHEQGFHNAVSACRQLRLHLPKPLELVVVGDVPRPLQDQYHSMNWITWQGVVGREQIPALCRGSHFYLPCEINAACPNSLIEAMACGTPTVGFDTGSIAELVGGEAGVVVPYGADDQKLEPANPSLFVPAALNVIHKNSAYRIEARKRAEKCFNAIDMVEKYITILEA